MTPIPQPRPAGPLAIMLASIAAFALSGCHGLFGFRNLTPPEPPIARPNPVLSYDSSTEQVIDHLNQNADMVRSWISRDCRMSIRMPNGMPVRLKATIACEEPRNFRLVADGSLVVRADVGSNAGHCWWWMQPGDNYLFVVPHDQMDYVRNHPLMQQAMSMPFEPDWLMQVLGVTRIDSEGMSMHRDPHPERVNLVSEYTAPDGRAFRRITVVDLHSGRVISHRMVDQNNHTIARARLSDFQLHSGAALPGRLEIDWPTMEMSLTISIRRMSVNGTLAAELWQPPQDKSLRVVRLADFLEHMEASGQTPNALGQQHSSDQPIHDPAVRPAGALDNELPWDDEPKRRSWFRWPFSRR